MAQSSSAGSCRLILDGFVQALDFFYHVVDLATSSYDFFSFLFLGVSMVESFLLFVRPGVTCIWGLGIVLLELQAISKAGWSEATAVFPSSPYCAC